MQEENQNQSVRQILELEGELQALSGAELEGYEIHMGRNCVKAKPDTVYPLKIRYQGERKEDGAYCKMSAEPMSMEFLTEKMWQRLLYVLGEKKGIDVISNDLPAHHIWTSPLIIILPTIHGKRPHKQQSISLFSRSLSLSSHTIFVNTGL
ncbi:MAG: hypothetical protein ACLUGJ_02890 [Blautia wexlerae]